MTRVGPILERRGDRQLPLAPCERQDVSSPTLVNLLEWRSKDLFAERYSQRGNDLERYIGWKQSGAVPDIQTSITRF